MDEAAVIYGLQVATINYAQDEALKLLIRRGKL